jgi:muconolactone delta-isomerase
MAQFIALLKRNLDDHPEAAFTPELLEAEAERARHHYAKGTNRAMWSRGDVAGAVVLIEAESAEEAKSGLATLPLYERGMLVIESLIPLLPYRGFGPRSG